METQDRNKADQLVEQFGDDAYHRAVEMTMTALYLGDAQGAEIYAGAARELLKMGYHKKPQPNDGQSG